MKILWFTWKDLKHPLAGGAEVVNEELAKRLVEDGHEVTLVVGGYKNAEPSEIIDGYKVVRLGSRYTLYWHAFRYYKRHLAGWADLVIDEVNTMPFFAKYYVKEPNVLFVHMLCRRVWFYQLPLPLSLAGYILEPLYIRLLSDRRVITISESTKKDLTRHGFKADQISIISQGISIEPITDLATVSKFQKPTILSLGAIRPMKRTHLQIQAFEKAKQRIPDLQLKVAGGATGSYGKKVLRMIEQSPYAADIEYLGKVSDAQKIELMQKAHAISVTSIKEGWGLIVTEAGSQGTPALVYDIDGLRDSVRHNKTGIVASKNDSDGLANIIVTALSDNAKLKDMGQAAYRWSKQITFNKSYAEFKQVIGLS